MYRYFLKRLFDIILSSLGILVLGIPMLFIAIIIKCDSRGPAIFTQLRVGKNCKNFRFYKFRSMSISAPKNCATRLIESDAYITKVGKFIRKTSLDELPQLFCIFVGSMSLIGPRPVVTTETDLIEARKLTGAYKVRAGLTGLAQISGRDKIVDMQFKADLDGKYAKRITLLGDAKIFLQTIGKVFKRDGVVEGEKIFQLATVHETVQPESTNLNLADVIPMIEVSCKPDKAEPSEKKSNRNKLQELDIQPSEQHTA